MFCFAVGRNAESGDQRFCFALGKELAELAQGSAREGQNRAEVFEHLSGEDFAANQQREMFFDCQGVSSIARQALGNDEHRRVRGFILKFAFERENMALHIFWFESGARRSGPRKEPRKSRAPEKRRSEEINVQDPQGGGAVYAAETVPLTGAAAVGLKEKVRAVASAKLS
jgi:hypothetical protein